MASKRPLTKAVRKEALLVRFEELGLFSLERAKAEEMSLQKRATC